MNIIAKIWAWLALAIGIMAFLTSMTGEVFDGTAYWNMKKVGGKK